MGKNGGPEYEMDKEKLARWGAQGERPARFQDLGRAPDARGERPDDYSTGYSDGYKDGRVAAMRVMMTAAFAELARQIEERR